MAKNRKKNLFSSGCALADSVTTFSLSAWRYEDGTTATSNSKPPAGGGVSVTDHGSAAGTDTASGRGRTFTEVPSTIKAPDAGTAATDTPLVVRTSTPDTGLPSASLFRTSATGHYLIETDPRFASYRSWLSSDYMINALGLDPNNVLKRLGDGFYEQKLIREQIAQLTGYRYLGGFTNDTDQYTALMNAGLTFAQQYGLRPGIALSAAQMAQLTSDIVWLVEREVTLANGSTQRVLVPQVYVRVKPGDIDGSGGLLSADALVIKGGADGKGAGDLINTGTLAGRTLVAINADNVQNLGGRIAGGSVGINARNDLNNIGGSMEARDAAVLTAGRDVNIRTTTSTQTSSQGKANGSYASVTEQSGIKAGDQGFDVNVKGHTDLQGGVISSTQAAIDGKKNSFQTASLTTSDIENHSTYKASGYSVSGSVGFMAGGAAQQQQAMSDRGMTDKQIGKASNAAPGGSAGVGSASGSQTSTTKAGISGIAGDATVRSNDTAASTGALVKNWDTTSLIKDVQAQTQITQEFGQRASTAWGTYSNGKLADAIEREDAEAAACWSANGSCRVAGHGVIGALTGGADGALGSMASTSMVPYVDQAVTSAGLTGAAHDAVVAGLAGSIGAALGGTAGATASFNEVNNNYLTSRQWGEFSDDIGQCKARSCTAEEQKAIRESYQQLSNQQNIALANCDATKSCATLRNDVAAGTQTMLALAANGQLPVGGTPANDLGQYIAQRTANDPSYRATVNHSIEVLNNCNANPDACTQQAVRAAALVVFPLLGPAGVPLTAEGIAIGGTVGATANIGGQLYASGGNLSQLNPRDAAMAFYTGAVTYGAAFWPSLFVNTGGAVTTSAMNDANASAAGLNITGAAFGSTLGYPIGAAVQGGLNSVMNPWYRSMWQDIGYTMQQWVKASSLPSAAATAASSAVQEVGNAAVNASPAPKITDRPTRAGQ